MIQANLPSGQYLLIDVDEGIRDIRMFKGNHESYLLYRPKEFNAPGQKIQLPEGQWELIGKADAVSEEVAAGIVEGEEYIETVDHNAGGGGRIKIFRYKDYGNEDYDCEDALSSFASWLGSLGLEAGKVCIVKKV